MRGTVASGEHRVIPVVVIDSPDEALRLADTLVTAGIHAIEVTFRTPGASGALRQIASHGGLIAGAGTITSIDDLHRAADAGATFAVSPGFDPALVEATIGLGLESLPGIATPTELQAAAQAGLDLVKVFPVELLGGTAYLDALSRPFPAARFMPSGGVGRADLGRYLRHPAVTAVGCSWIATRAAIAARDFSTIRTRAAAAAAIVRGELPL